MPIPPIEVQRLGQSIWTDNISRELITSGELARAVEDGGVMGLTSNPTIFQHAISNSEQYNDLIRDHLDLSANELYERLAIRDIQDAADILRPVYDRTGGADGYVSFEVSPLLAYDKPEQTINEAKRLFTEVDRPNVMIKIPATPAGIPAIEASIAAGINVNVTLIFSIKNYEEVAEAYIKGLEKRLESGESVEQVASVASFFVSRIDVMIDTMLENNIRAATGRDLDRVASNRKLLGQAGIANARLAYHSFQRLFEVTRFTKLREAGAMVQRPLWASTGTKNPAYPDTMYVDNLIGKHTVNTLPPATLEAFTDHGTVAETITNDVNKAADIMDMLAEINIDFDQITHQLQTDGVEMFIDSFEALIAEVEAKRVILKTDIINQQKLALGIYREKVETAIDALDRELINVRLWNKDASVWKDYPPTMADIVARLGWLDVRKTIDIERLKTLQSTVKDSEWQHVVLLGMGGSSLAPEVLFKVFGQQDGFPELHVLDSTNPAQIKTLTDAIDVSKTLFLVSSKSGNTIETLSFYRYFWQLTGENGKQFIAITDPDSQLQNIAKANNFRDLFLNPIDIGGRYSALSYFGMVPAALMGLDLDHLWRHATNMIEACGELIPAKHHPGIWLGAIMGQLSHEKRDKLMIFGSDTINSFGAWAEQLIAESTGKQWKGILPVAGATVGKPHDYGSDRVFIYLKLEGDPSNDTMDDAIRTLREAGHPRVTLFLPDKYALAGEFFRWEYATAIAGKMLKINPFDEPNVAEAKKNTSELLSVYAEEGTLSTVNATLTESNVALYTDEMTITPLRELCTAHGFDSTQLTDLLAAQILGTEAGDYFTLLAYAEMTDTTAARLQEIQRLLRHYTRRAITYGFGPRYLHSTGQLHKGGPNNGVFFQFTHDVTTDIDIPGAGYSFGTLHAAQAAGDVRALLDHKRRTVRLHVSGDSIDPALDIMMQAMEAVAARRQ